MNKDTKRRFHEILCHSKRIVIFGHSAHGIDYDYYKEFLSIERPNTDIILISKSREDCCKIRHGMMEKGCKANIDILAVDGVGSNDYKEFMKLCEKIASE